MQRVVLQETNVPRGLKVVKHRDLANKYYILVPKIRVDESPNEMKTAFLIWINGSFPGPLDYSRNEIT